jgi:hypothetical protein
MEAAIKGRTEIVRLLLTNGADVTLQSTGGTTALMEAAFKGHTEIVRLLLTNGAADVNTKDDKGWTALMEAAFYGDAGIVRRLLAKGADPKLKNRDGRTALQIARGRGHQDIVDIIERWAMNRRIRRFRADLRMAR